jgi:hypothetical protein
MTANPFNAPHEVFDAIQRGVVVGPLYKAAKKLGPTRVQWIGDAGRRASGKPLTFCNWSLDGKPVRARDILIAARVRRGESLEPPRTAPLTVEIKADTLTRVMSAVASAGADGLTTKQLSVRLSLTQTYVGVVLRMLRARNLVGTRDGLPVCSGRTTHWVAL